jgi:hypothetical protein
MDNKERKNILDKLEKIKKLAERGIGGERETAIKMYEELRKKYEISPEEIAEQNLEERWFSYKTDLEEPLLLQIFYKVTGDTEHFAYTGKYRHRKKRGVVCTELEAVEIQMLFNFYREEMKKELEVFKAAFINKNDLFPDETARMYKKTDSPEMSDEEIEKYRKAAQMAEGMDKKQPPRAAIEDKKGNAE